MEFDRCILCGQPLSQETPSEHVIPDYLGGLFALRLLCKNCNHGIGARLYSLFKMDVYIRKAGTIFKDQLPAIHDSIEKRQLYTTTTPTGTTVSALRTNKGIHLRSGPQADGSVLLRTTDAIPFLAHQLMKEERLSKEKAFAIAGDIWNVPNKQLHRVSRRHKIVRWNAEGFKKDFSRNTIIDDRASALIAYEYIAILLGKSIYDEIFNPVRSYIMNGDENKHISVHKYITTKPQPFHLIYPEFFEDRTAIHIHLFEYAVYTVEIRNLRINNSPDVAHLEDLINNLSLWALSVKEAKDNKWRELEGSIL